MRKVLSIIFICISFFIFADKYDDFFIKVKETSNFLRSKINTNPKLMIVLTCFVNGPEEELLDKKEISSSEIPNFPKASAQGHEGKLVFGKLNGVDVVLLKGRYHYYEGHSVLDVVFPYFVLNDLGVVDLITVNAVGGIRFDLNPGDIFLINDHINMYGKNPLRGIALKREENQFTEDARKAPKFIYGDIRA